MNRRAVLCTIAAVSVGGAWAAPFVKIAVHKSPSCGCCGDWVRHLEDAGFQVSIVESADLSPLKTKAGVPAALQSCHTAFVGGYIVEGHVPAATISRLLAARPAIRGIAVPGMPIGSPGIDVPGEKSEPFRVMAFGESGAPRVFEDFPEGYRRSPAR